MENEQRLGGTRYRVYQIIGIVVGVAFLALGVLAFLFGGGPIVGWIGVVGGAITVTVAIVNMVRS